MTINQIFIFTLLFFISAFIVPMPADAESIAANDEYLAPNQKNASDAKAIIEEILSGEEFSKKTTQEVWRFKNMDEPDKIEGFDFAQDIIKALSLSFKFLVITALIVLIILLIYYRKQWLVVFQRKSSKNKAFNAPDILFGMDIRPESLPRDIPATAKQLWDTGKHREALSLLYRGALMHLVQYANIPLDQSHTEGDVLTISQQSLKKHINNNTVHLYLKNLTQAWQTIAYAHRLPNDKLINELITHWQTEFQQPLHDYQKNMIEKSKMEQTK